MTLKNRVSWVLLVGLLSISPVFQYKTTTCDKNKVSTKLENCFTHNEQTHFVVAEKFYDVIENSSNFNACVVFVQHNSTVNQSMDDDWPQWDMNNSLYISKHLINLNFNMSVISGNNCSALNFTQTKDFNCVFNYSDTDLCQARCINTGTICQTTTYTWDKCDGVDSMYVVNVKNTTINCMSCDNPVKRPTENVTLNVSLSTSVGGEVDAADAVNVMASIPALVSTMNTSSAALSAGVGITGVVLAYKNPVDIEEVTFAYASPNDSINIISSKGNFDDFSRSVSVPKEAFQLALRLNIISPFATLMRFNHMEKDALNSTLLDNEVIAVDMGVAISNLTDKINISFRGLTYNWIPSCHSWNGEGSQPNWTQDGCETIISGPNITCQCSHLTFFAILMTAPNETISSTDLNNLTIITQVGCGLSILFLSIILFMHFLMRRTATSKSSLILMHLVLAMLLLDLAFLVNNPVANLQNSVGCMIMGAAMHYFMLATFTWFAAQAFHLCFQLYTGGKILIRRYVLKISISSWVLPSIIVITMLIKGKYGEENVISSDSTTNNAAMCWITDVNIHYFVNIGYYALVFLFTFTTFIIIVSWLVCLKRQKGGTQVNRIRNGSKSMVSFMGLCCILGLTWGFAFFAFGALRIAACYIFTILNSFQGFFLFVYYYNTRKRAPPNTDASNKASTCSTATLQTSLDVLMNPYRDPESKT